MKNKDASKRAIRRHHKARLVDRILSTPIWCNAPKDLVTKSVDHLARCSCEMCGNPRKYFGRRTRSEQESDLALREYESGEA